MPSGKTTLDSTIHNIIYQLFSESLRCLAQSAGVVEYTDCFSAVG